MLCSLYEDGHFQTSSHRGLSSWRRTELRLGCHSRRLSESKLVCLALCFLCLRSRPGFEAWWWLVLLAHAGTSGWSFRGSGLAGTGRGVSEFHRLLLWFWRQGPEWIVVQKQGDAEALGWRCGKSGIFHQPFLLLALIDSDQQGQCLGSKAR